MPIGVFSAFFFLFLLFSLSLSRVLILPLASKLNGIERIYRPVKGERGSHCQNVTYSISYSELLVFASIMAVSCDFGAIIERHRFAFLFIIDRHGLPMAYLLLLCMDVKSKGSLWMCVVYAVCWQHVCWTHLSRRIDKLVDSLSALNNRTHTKLLWPFFFSTQATHN